MSCHVCATATYQSMSNHVSMHMRNIGGSCVVDVDCSVALAPWTVADCCPRWLSGCGCDSAVPGPVIGGSVARIRYAAPARRLPCRPAGSTVVSYVYRRRLLVVCMLLLLLWLRHLTMGVLCCLPDARTGSSVFIIIRLFDEFS